MFVVEGNIGSGKSTLLRKLETKGIQVIQEPVDEWFNIKNDDNDSIFELFNKDPHKYAFEFQMYVMLSRLKKLYANINNNIVFERSILTDKHIFVDTLRDSNILTTIQEDIFKDWFNYVFKDTKKIKGIIYLRMDPKVCFERIAQRDRKSESNISLEYLLAIHKKHEDWLLNNSEYNVLIIDDNDETNIEKIIEFIKCHSIETS